jgi:hypothetical protein
MVIDPLAGLLVQRDQEGFLLVVVDQVDSLALEYRRGGRPPAETRRDALPSLRPQQLSLEVEAEHAHVTEVSVHTLPVGDRGLRGQGVLQMVTVLGDAAVDFLLPDDPAAVEVQAADHPTVDFLRCRSLAAEIESPLDRFGFSPFLDRGGNENPLTPDDRRGPTTTRDHRLPRDPVRRAPGIRQPGVATYSRRRGAAELRPIVGRSACVGRPPGDDKQTYRRRYQKSTMCEHCVTVPKQSHPCPAIGAQTGRYAGRRHSSLVKEAYRSRWSVTSGLNGSKDSFMVQAMARSRMIRK